MAHSRKAAPMISAESADTLRFGNFEIDSLRQEVKKSGYVLHVPHQAFRVLFLLATRAGEVITREEIQQEIWGEETFVDFEQGINAVIRQVRMALSDNAESPRYVETRPRLGYCFIAPVERVARANSVLLDPGRKAPVVPLAVSTAPAIQKSRSKTWWIVAIVLIAVIAIVAGVLLRRPTRAVEASRPRARNTVIALLPFRSIGALPQGVSPQAISEELRAILGRMLASRIRVLDGRAVSDAAGASQNQAELAKRMGATLAIDGVIQRVPSGVQVIVTGSDAASHAQLWTETYERPIERTAGMAVEVAHFVTRSVAERYLPPPRHEARLLTKVSPRALSLYRQARVERNRPRPHRNVDRAAALFEQAAQMQPGFAEAWSGLADLWVEAALSGKTYSGRAEAARRSQESAHRALAIQPENAEAHDALGLIAFQRDYDYRVAEDEFRRTVAEDPDYPDGHVNLALLLTAMGQSDEAQVQWSIGQQLDPVSLDLSPFQAILYLDSRRYEDALSTYREMLDIHPDSVNGNWGMLSVLIVQNRWRDAIALTRQIAQQPPLPAAAPADRAAFQREYKRLEPYMDSSMRRGIFNGYALAVFYAELGDSGRAFATLQRAIDDRLPSVCWMLVDPRLNPLRRDPRFRALVQRAGLTR
jgi:DNA-binding winged helix-turn-helix (wHTH) protein/tetratricopeptide (TPR) repeat protein/TolB-like protein